MKINSEQKILLKKLFFSICAIMFFTIFSKYIIILAPVLLFIFKNIKLENEKYNSIKFPLPDDVLDNNIFIKIFSVIYYIILLPLFFLGYLENKSLVFSLLIFSVPIMLILFFGLTIFYRRLGGEEVDIEEKPRKTLLRNKQKK